jgi:hypothetical protein
MIHKKIMHGLMHQHNNAILLDKSQADTSCIHITKSCASIHYYYKEKLISQNSVPATWR